MQHPILHDGRLAIQRNLRASIRKDRELLRCERMRGSAKHHARRRNIAQRVEVSRFRCVIVGEQRELRVYQTDANAARALVANEMNVPMTMVKVEPVAFDDEPSEIMYGPAWHGAR